MTDSAKQLEAGPNSWAEYRQISGDARWEIADGVPMAMTAPSISHQRTVRELTRALGDAFSGAPCELFPAPCDVVLSERDVFQPDLLVVCDPGKIRDSHIAGAPDLVIEVLSPNSISIDRLKKLHIYAKYGVREYWIVTPEPFLVEVFVLDGRGYRIHDVFSAESTLSSAIFPELKIKMNTIIGKE